MQEKALLQGKRNKKASVVLKLHRRERKENTASCMNEMLCGLLGYFHAMLKGKIEILVSGLL